MKIRYCSDLHLEFEENLKYMKVHPILPGDILILAGDITILSDVHNPKYDFFFEDISKNFKHIYWIPGNHEYYHFNIPVTSSFHTVVRPNIHLVNNISLLIENVRFIFSTLWSNITPQNEYWIRRQLSDFNYIKYKGETLTPSDYNDLHTESLSFIKSQLDTVYHKTCVVTHHMPTFKNYNPEYLGNTLNEAFATEQYDLIDASGIEYWIYGHTHYNHKQFMINKTKILTNQLGYVYSEDINFKNKSIDI